MEGETKNDLVRVPRNGMNLVHDEEKTGAMWLESVYDFDDMPEKMLTDDFYLQVIQTYPLLLDMVPKERRTKKLCLAAVREDGWALEYVPETLRTTEFCMEATRKDGWRAFPYVPEPIKTQAFYLHLVKHHMHLSCVPDEMINEEICLEAMRKNDTRFEFVPVHLRTEKVCALVGH